MLQTQTVAEDTLALIKRLTAESRLNDFTLVGGTALALTLGHRNSIDIDLFSNRDFNSGSLGQWLKDNYSAYDMQTINNGVFCYIDNVKIDLITHAYPEVVPHQTVEGVRMMSLTDIAAMKLHAIVQSGTRLKDFTDVYFMLEHMPLSAMYAAYEKKYFPNGNPAVARLALNDTSGISLGDEIHLLGRPFDWPEIKNRLRTAIESPQQVFRETRAQNLILDDKTSPSSQKSGGLLDTNDLTANSIILATSRPIQDKSLLAFLQEHRIPLDIAQKLCSEVDFLSGGRRQKAIGFENRSGGFELRNKSFSGSSYPLDASILNDDNNRLCVFENFLDLLSYAAILEKRNLRLPGCLVLNDLPLLEKYRPLMEQRQQVALFLHRNESGRDATRKVLSWNSKLNMERYSDGSKLYVNKRSLSEWLIDQPKQVQKQSRNPGMGL